MTDRMSITFRAPAEWLTLNQRLHWADRARRVKSWRRAAALHARKTRPGAGPCALEMLPSFVRVTFGVRDPGRRRDPHNYMPTVKAIIDGLVDAGVWPDDTAEWVTVHDSQFERAATRTVTVDIWPREAQP
jgi:crossover junction endodeoxyribonuclease RusA